MLSQNIWSDSFEYVSTENFNGEDIEIGWIKYSSCIEGNNLMTLNADYTESEIVDLAKRAVTVKILPFTDVPGSSETAEYAVTADICSNPVFALNNGYQMDYTVDSDLLVSGYSNVDNWSGTDSATNRLSNGCYECTSGLGQEPWQFTDLFYWACCNGAGIHSLFISMSC